MAFYLDEEEKEQEGGQGFTPGGQSSDLGSDGGTGVGGASGQPSNKPDNPGNFVGLKTYLDANKSQSQKLGDNVSGQVSGSIDNAQTNINNLNSQFDQSAKSGLINDFDNAGTQAQNISNNASLGTKQNLPNQADVTRFGEIANAQYKGPKGVEELEGYNPVLQSISEAQKLSGLAGTEEGKIGLVKNAASPQGKYSEGQAKLDSYLLGGDENKQKLETARAGFQNINPLFDTTKTNAKTQASLYDKQTNDLKNNTRNLLKNTALARQAAIQQDLQAQRLQTENRQKETESYRQLFGDTSDAGDLSLSSAQAQALGLTGNQQLYGALNQDPSFYFQNQGAFDENKAISVDDQARMAALAGLSGTFGGEFTNKFGQAGLAGTYNNVDQVPLAKQKIQDEIARRKGIYDTADNNLEWLTDNEADKTKYRSRTSVPKTAQEIIERLERTFAGAPDIGYNKAAANAEELYNNNYRNWWINPYDIHKGVKNWQNKYGKNDKVTIK